MATVTIRNLETTVIENLKARAASNSRSMEAEARAIITGAATESPAAARGGLGTEIMNLFAGLDTSDLVFERDPELPRDVIFEE